MASNNESRQGKGHVNRRNFLSTLGIAAAAATGSSRANGQETGQGHSDVPGDQREAAERRRRRQAARGIKTTAKGNNLNLIVIVADTWRTDHIGAYGGQRAKTPCLDEFAKRAVLFEHNYADGLPTIPARRVYHTGKSIIPGAHWIPLPAEDVTLSQILKTRGYWSGLICDVYHYFKPDMNMHVGFDTWEWIRGQEMDAYRGGPHGKFDPKKHMPAELWNPSYDRNMRQYMMNTQDFRGEDDYFCARTVSSAIRWLDMNATNSPFMLWVEMFDPHEPWDPPPRFAKMYRDDYGYERFLFGYGVQGGGHSGGHKPNFEPHLPVIRDLYRAEVTFTDSQIGRLLAAIEKRNLMDDTVVVFTSDHGTHLGELGYVQKQPALLNRLVMHIPLMIHHPDRSTAGKRVSALTSTIDYAPTFCELLGIDDQEQMDGKNMWPLVSGKSERLRERTFTQFGNFASVRDLGWHYFQHLSGRNAGAGPCLYDLKADPGETKNVLKDHPERGGELREQLATRMERKLPEPVAAGT